MCPSPYLAMLCPKPAIPSNSYIIYPRSKQVNYTHGTRVFLACRDGHYLKGSPIMLCNRTVWFKKEFSCIGKFLLRIQARRVNSVEGVLIFVWSIFFFFAPKARAFRGVWGHAFLLPGKFCKLRFSQVPFPAF